jgi:hypothetical protein
VRKFYDANVPNRKFYLTTKHTKATKVSDIDISKLLNFVFFVTFVVKFAFFSLVAALPR